MKTTLSIYWAVLFLCFIARVIFEVIGNVISSICVLGILFFIIVISLQVESIRFTEYYKNHYPEQFKDMLSSGDFRLQFQFSPEGDKEIKFVQLRMKKFLVFVIGALIINIIFVPQTANLVICLMK